MPLSLAQRYAWVLAQTLMVCIVLIETPDGYFAMPSDEFDGDPESLIREYDPFAFA